MERNSTTQLAALAGIIGPALFLATFVLAGWLRPGYSSQAMYISALSLGPEGWIQKANFVVFGTLLFVFAYGAAVQFKNEKVSQAGPVLISIMAICFFLSGPFVMDPMDTLPAQASLHGIIHGILGGIVFLLMPVSCFVSLGCFGKDSEWKSFRSWTKIAGTIITIALVFFSFSTKLPQAKVIFHDWFGLIQRSVLIPYMVWLFTFALAFYERQLSKNLTGFNQC